MKLSPAQESVLNNCLKLSGPHAADFPQEEIDQSIPERFERAVQLHPERLAAKINGHAITYDELNRQANRIAHFLLNSRGTRSEAVALKMEQDISYLAAVFGVLKANKICVHVDPSQPKAHQESILEDAQAEVVLVRGGDAADKSEGLQHLTLIDIDALDSSLASDDPRLRIASSCPANVIYTSGTTGRPKGVVQSHGYVLHKVLIDRLFLTEQDRFVQLGRLSGEVFNILLNGAGFFSWNIRRGGFNNLAERLTAEGITVFRSTPSIFRYFCTQLKEGDTLPTISRIILGGEAVYRSDVDLFKRHFEDDCVLINKYGGGEAGPISWYVCTKDTQIPGTVVPAGYAFPGKTIVIEDGAPDDQTHELGREVVVKSRHIATGYWNNRDLSSAAFGSASGSGGERLFRTGDLGSLEADGCLLVHGRRDSRVKIRGHSVDMGAVESVMLEHQGLKEAAVTVSRQDGKETFLAGYYVPIQPRTVSPYELRKYLTEKLPSFMVPARLMVLDHLPRTHTGKVDRRALPKPPTQRPEIDRPYEAPGTEIERELAKIWEDVLDVHPVGRADGFFDLGGHSLAATRVVSRVLDKFRLEIPLESLFAAPTIAEMASVIVAHQGKQLAETGLAAILDELESMSDSDANRQLDPRQPGASKQ